jgi:hypothetical protein
MCWLRGHQRVPLTNALISVADVGSVEICDRCSDLYFEGKDNFPVRYVLQARPDLGIKGGEMKRLV